MRKAMVTIRLGARVGLVCCSLAAWPVLAQPTDQAIEQAARQMKAYLWQAQDQQTGLWPVRQYAGSSQAGGDTALVVLALLCAGESAQHPQLQRALRWLKEASLQGTYAVSLRAMVWAQLSGQYLPLLEADVQALLAGADAHGQFGYTTTSDGTTNHSTTHYAVLALEQAAGRGVPVPATFWEKIQQHYLTHQRADGGWGYLPGLSDPPTGSMTAAGLTKLLIAEQQISRQASLVPWAADSSALAVQRGLDWLDTHFAGHHNPPGGSWTYYYLYAVQRAAMITGVRQFNRQDWYARGASHILSQQHPADGSTEAGSIEHSTIQTALALLFLTHGQSPIWISRLELDRSAGGALAFDLHRLTHRLGELAQRPLRWQRIDLDTPLPIWFDAPAVYLSSNGAVELDEHQQAVLKTYLDHGGVLLAGAQNGSRRFAASVKALGEQWYPDWPARALELEHPIYQAVYKLQGVDWPLTAIGPPSRLRILISEIDLGRGWQSSAEAAHHGAWQLGANFWAWVTGHGQGHDLQPPGQPYHPHLPVGQIVVGRLIGHVAEVPEPMAWQRLAGLLLQRANLRLNVVDVTADNLDSQPIDLLHLTGHDAQRLTDPQLAAVAAAARQGTLVLVENVGGLGDFAWQTQQRLSRLLDAPSQPLPIYHPLVTGKGLAEGYDNRQIAWRTEAAVNLLAGRQVRLAVIKHDRQPAVVISHEDLSLGMLGVGHAGILGYTPESSRRVAINLLLEAFARRQATR